MASDAHSSAPPVLVLCQLVGLEALRARVPAALRRTIDQLNRLLDALAAEMGGQRVRSPAIGVLTRWPTAELALDFAIRLQRDALVQDWPTTLLLRPEASEWRTPDGLLLHRGPRIRCAIHMGSPDRLLGSPGGDVLAGPALYQAARILATLHGGQTVLSHRVWEAIGELPDGVAAADLGEHTLIGVLGTSRFHQVLPEELSRRNFPAPRTRDVARTNTPPARPGFVGRDGDLQAIAELAGFGLRVITVTGPPGVGKSGLLSRYLHLHGSGFTAAGGGGAWLCRVEGVQVAHVIAAVAGTFGLSLRFGRTDESLLRQVGAALSDRGPTLLAIEATAADPEALAEALNHWLKAAPELKVLVASSRRLGVPGEITYLLAPLPRAATEGARNEPAVRMFVERATLRTARFHAGDSGSIASLVNALSGSPLAIELVAGLASKMSLEQLLAEVEQIDLGLDAAVALVWSHLDEEDRHVLSSCAVYAAGFDRLGAEAVVDIRETGIDAVAVLQRLERGGLVHRTDDPRTPEVRRYRVDRRLRARALSDLDPEERWRIDRRAALQILGQCEGWARDAWGPQGPEALARLGIEWVNLAAVAAAVAREGSELVDVDLGLRAVAVLWPLVACHGPTGLYVELASTVLDRADSMLEADPVFQARAFAGRAGARRNLGDLTGALADAERGAEVARRWADPEGEGLCALFAGLIHHARGRLPEAEAEVTRAISALDEPDPGQAAVARGVLGVIRMDQARLQESDALLVEATETLERLQWHRHLALQLTTRGLLHRRRGRLEAARDLYIRAAQLHRRVGDLRALAICLVNQASLELNEGRYDDAIHTLGEARATSQESGDRVVEARVNGNAALAALARGDVPLAREYLVAAMAIDRDLRDRVGEAVDIAYLGVTHHLVGQLDGARDNYKRALRVLEERAPLRDRVGLVAWLAAAEAEDGALEVAQAGIATARDLADQAGEPQGKWVVEILAGIVDVLAAPSSSEVRARVSSMREGGDGDPRDVDVVLARVRLGRVLDELTPG